MGMVALLKAHPLHAAALLQVHARHAAPLHRMESTRQSGGFKEGSGRLRILTWYCAERNGSGFFHKAQGLLE